MLRSKLLWLGIIVVAALAYYFYDQKPQPAKSEVKPVVTVAVAPITARPFVVQVEEEDIPTSSPSKPTKKVSEDSPVRAEGKPKSTQASEGRVATATARAEVLSVAPSRLASKSSAPAIVKVAQPSVTIPVVRSAGPQVTDLPIAVAPRVATSPKDNASQQALIDRAQYWESHGRSDLAEAARNQLTQAERGTAVESVKTEPRARVAVAAAAERPASKRRTPVENSDETSSSAVRPTQQQLLERAQYWESHGRSDLAEQIKQKLKTMEASLPANSARAESSAQTREDSSAARSALEDSLLKNPNSIQARLDLAQIYRSSGEMARARLQVDSVLKTNPDSPEALLSSAQLFSDQRLWMQTLHALEKVSPSARNTEMANLQKTAWAHVQIDRADTLVKQGNSAQAEVLLRQVALELAISAKQTPAEEPPALWKNSAPKKTSKK